MNDKERFHQELHRIFSKDEKLNALPLEKLLGAIPTIDQLTDIPAGKNVLVRLDLDVPLKEGKVQDMSRIEANTKTLEYCIDKGWTIIMLGHIGRDKTLSLEPVCKALSKEIDRNIELIPDWLDETQMKLLDTFIDKLKSAKPGALFLLENTRKYTIETALWKAKEADFQDIAGKMYSLAADFRDRVSNVEINEAIAASNFDFSSSALPLAMSQTALGFYLSEEMKQHIVGARQANLLIMSGLKIDKLNDLESIIERRSIKWLIAAGSLAMALKKAKAQLAGGDFSIGRAETNKDEKFFIPTERIEQGKRILERCAKDGVEVILPIDFVLDNGAISEEIPAGAAQFDIGPKTRELIAQKIAGYIALAKKADVPFAMFYNGVFGKFEDARYETGTREFIALLKEMSKAGIAVYVGGGEGRLALLKYGSLNDAKHAFTAGGTILKSLSNRHIAFLEAMYSQNAR
jgi:phosphoglycerate kinase